MTEGFTIKAESHTSDVTVSLKKVLSRLSERLPTPPTKQCVEPFYVQATNCQINSINTRRHFPPNRRRWWKKEARALFYFCARKPLSSTLRERKHCIPFEGIYFRLLRKFSVLLRFPFDLLWKPGLMSNPFPEIWSLMIDGFTSRYFDVSEAISGELKALIEVF